MKPFAFLGFCFVMLVVFAAIFRLALNRVPSLPKTRSDGYNQDKSAIVMNLFLVVTVASCFGEEESAFKVHGKNSRTCDYVGICWDVGLELGVFCWLLEKENPDCRIMMPYAWQGHGYFRLLGIF